MALNNNQKLDLIAKLSQKKQKRILDKYGGDHNRATQAIKEMEAWELVKLLRDAQIMEEAQALEDQLAQEAVLEGQGSEVGDTKMSLESAEKAVRRAEEKVRRSSDDSPEKDKATNLVQRAKDNLNRANIALEQENFEGANKYAQKAITQADQAEKLTFRKNKNEKSGDRNKNMESKNEKTDAPTPKSESGTVSKAQVAKKMASAEGSATDRAKTVGKEIAAETAGEALGDAAAAATAETGPLALAVRKAVKWVAENIIKKIASRPLWKSLLAAFAPQMLTIIFIVIGLSIASKAFAGNWGIGRSNSIVDPTSNTDIASVQEVVGQSNMIPGDPTSWYFSQADPEFNKTPLNGSWPSGKNMLRQAGCAITSATMMARIYGVTDITPVDFANRMANGGSLNLRVSMVSTYVNEHMEDIGSGTRYSIKKIPTSLDSVKKYISNGHPILTQGYKAFEGPGAGASKSQHWVLVVGVSNDDRWLVISDPAGSNWGGHRGSPARFTRVDQLNNQIKTMYALVER